MHERRDIKYIFPLHIVIIHQSIRMVSKRFHEMSTNRVLNVICSFANVTDMEAFVTAWVGILVNNSA